MYQALWTPGGSGDAAGGVLAPLLLPMFEPSVLSTQYPIACHLLSVSVCLPPHA